VADTEKGKPVPAAAAPAAEGHNAPFLSRWSRLKQEARDHPVEKPRGKPEATDPKAPPELPPLDQLTIDSDYRAFFHPKVGEDVRRAALKKLFSDPSFNVMDGLDVYIDDYSKSDPIPPEMLAGLRQARKIIAWAKGEEDKPEEGEQPLPAAAAGQAALEPPGAPSAPAVEPQMAVPEPTPVASRDAGEPTGS
jgi:hypothetical protein